MNRIHSLFAVAVASLALSSVACAAPQGDDADDENRGEVKQGATRGDLAAPAPEPVVIKCVTSLGTHEGVTQSQCEALLKIAGCAKPGAVVNDKQKCSTASTDPAAGGDRPGDLAAPAPEPVVIKCITSLGTHEGVTQSQCESLLRIAGCTKPGAVVNETQKCSTASTDPAGPAPGGPTDLSNGDPDRTVLKCITSLGTHEGVTQSQCEQLLAIAGCAKPGAVLNDTQKCSTAN